MRRVPVKRPGALPIDPPGSSLPPNALPLGASPGALPLEVPEACLLAGFRAQP